MSAPALPTDFKWPVSVERVIAAPASRVWDTISSPGNLEPCHPYCAANPVIEWPGPHARDEVHYLSGWVYERRFSNWIEGVGYDLEIGRPHGGQSLVSWRITTVDDSHSALRITVYPHALQKVPTILRWIPHRLRLRPQLQNYLDSVVRGFEWNIVRGEPVPKDAFGRHPWFSAQP